MDCASSKSFCRSRDYQPLDSNGVVVDDVDVNSIRIAYLDKAEFAEKDMNNPNGSSQLVSDFGYLVLDFFNFHIFRDYVEEEFEVLIQQTPEWVQCLVRRCRVDSNFESMSAVLEYLDEM